jgi:DNA-directed RNA polymerase subunit RPC12/RpoP
MTKYLCDDCEEYFESEKDPTIENIYDDKTCICEDCNDRRVYNLYG